MSVEPEDFTKTKKTQGKGLVWMGESGNKDYAKKICSGLLCIALSAGFLTSCGGELTGISGDGAVSGEEVSGSVTKNREKTRNEAKTDMSRHRFCTDTNLYYVGGDTDRIMQARLDGTHRKCIRKCKEGKNAEADILYVGTEWLYYSVRNDYGEETIYRSPVEKDKKGYDVVRFRDEEVIYEGANYKEVLDEYEENIPIYMDADYCFYTDECRSGFAKYDRRANKKISQRQHGLNGEGEIIRIKDYYLYRHRQELYRQKVSSTRWEVVSEHIIKGMDGKIFFVNNGREVFYPRYVDKVNKIPFQIWSCDGKRKRKFVTRKQLSSAVESVTGTHKHDVCMPSGLFWQQGRLYIQLQTGWMVNGIYHMEHMVFSRGEGGDDPKLRYEKRLTECMKSHVEAQRGKWTDDILKAETVFVKHMVINTAQCIGMADGKAYFSLYDYKKDRGRMACYDLDRGKLKWISRKNAAFYKLGYDIRLDKFGAVFQDITYNDFVNSWTWYPSEDDECYGSFVKE